MIRKNIEFSDGRLLVIREAEKKDTEAVLVYINKIAGQTEYLTFGPGEFKLSITQEEQFIEDHRESGNKLFIIAEIDETVVGTLAFVGGMRKKIRHTGEFGFSVSKDYWGLGIGTRLIEALIEWAKASEIIQKINLRVRADNAGAIEIYKRFGFVEEGMITMEFFIDGKFYDNVFMGLKID